MHEIILDGNTQPTTYAMPLSQSERGELRDELTWRNRQYYDALLGGHMTVLGYETLRGRVADVERLLCA